MRAEREKGRRTEMSSCSSEVRNLGDGQGKAEKERIRREDVIKTLLIQRIMEAPSSPTASRNVHWALKLGAR